MKRTLHWYVRILLVVIVLDFSCRRVEAFSNEEF